MTRISKFLPILETLVATLATHSSASAELVDDNLSVRKVNDSFDCVFKVID